MAVALIGVLTLYDWIRPSRGDLRDFDPAYVARLETSMWRAYYDRQRLRLYTDLCELLRRQYHMSLTRSYVTAFYAARAAFVFKDGKSRADYERALPGLRRYYAEIRAASATPFDVERVARLELEWWISHRNRSAQLQSDLGQLQSAIYSLPPERFQAHAQARAEAMYLRDDRAAAGSVSDQEWEQIDRLLLRSWTSLHTAVNRVQ
jgi:hypothetical protein